MRRYAPGGRDYTDKRMDSKNIKTLLIIALVTVVVVGGFFLLFEKADKEVYTKGSPEARRNPFLAANRYLNTIGIPSESSNRRDFFMTLPPVGDMIFIHKSISNLPEKREEQLVSWVENGGALVIKYDPAMAAIEMQKENTLLKRFGITFQSEEDSDDSSYENNDKNDTKLPSETSVETNKQDKATDKKEEDCVCESNYKEIVSGIFRGEQMSLEFLKGSSLLPEDSDSLSSFFVGEFGPHMLRKSMGAGEVIVLSDDYFLQNKRIGERDHAFFY